MEWQRQLARVIPVDEPCGDVEVVLWNGEHWLRTTAPPRYRLLLRGPSALKTIVRGRSTLALGRAYVKGELEVEGDLELAVALSDHLIHRSASILTTLEDWAFRCASYLSRAPALAQSIAYHYDLSGNFFRVFLDRRMVYSCAYYASDEDTLEQAQENKLELVCRKLDLSPGETLLDMGCGWASLVVFARETRGSRATGLTLSLEQHEHGKRALQALGFDDCTVEYGDFLDTVDRGSFEKIACLGAVEHVPPGRLHEFFSNAYGYLTDGGKFLVQSITRRRSSKTSARPAFVGKDVFPGAELVPVGRLLGEAEQAGFEVRDVECLRGHYVLTIREWAKRLSDGKDTAIQLVGEPSYRLFRLWMAGFAAELDRGALGLYQILLEKPRPGATAPVSVRDGWVIRRPRTVE